MEGDRPSSCFSEDDQAYFFDQLDGNTSLDSSATSHISEGESLFNNFSNPIPAQIGHRPSRVINERPPYCRKTIRRDNKTVQALTLPKLTNYNMRSFFPKCDNFAQDMEEREVT